MGVAATICLSVPCTVLASHMLSHLVIVRCAELCVIMPTLQITQGLGCWEASSGSQSSLISEQGADSYPAVPCILG